MKGDTEQQIHVQSFHKFVEESSQRIWRLSNQPVSWNNVSINVKPHYGPPPGLNRGLVGDFDQNICPNSGAFDRSRF